MSATQTLNLEDILATQRDAYAKRQGAFILTDEVVRIGDGPEVWDFLRACGDRIFRVVYMTQKGEVRDMIGRQGVYASEQDGHVAGTGHAMAKAGTHLSFWTFAHGQKVNNGSGKGYRTLITASIIAIRCEGHDIVTDFGDALIGECLTQGHPPLTDDMREMLGGLTYREWLARAY